MTSNFSVSLTIDQKNDIYFHLKNQSDQDYYICSYHIPLELPKGLQLLFIDSKGKKASYEGKLVSRVPEYEAYNSWVKILKGETISKKCDIDYYSLTKGTSYTVTLKSSNLLFTDIVTKGVKIQHKSESIQCNSLNFTF